MFYSAWVGRLAGRLGTGHREPRRSPVGRPGGFTPRGENLEDRTVPTVYEVGPGLAFTSLGAVPWGQLAAGDTVNLHWRPEAYHELVLISSRGTQAAPIRFVGVSGPSGQRPVIDGSAATMAPTVRYAYEGSAT